MKITARRFADGLEADLSSMDEITFSDENSIITLRNDDLIIREIQITRLRKTDKSVDYMIYLGDNGVQITVLKKDFFP